MGMFKAVFSKTPGWIKDVEKNGIATKAVISSDPKTVMGHVQNYEGRDVWLDVEAQVEGDEIYEAKLKCKLSQITFGMLAQGMRVNVKYDPKDRNKVMLSDDVNTLLSYRARK